MTPNDDTKYLSLKVGNLSVSARVKTIPITDIQVWTDDFGGASIFVRAHYEVSISLFKYLHVIRFGASKASRLGWCDYDIQFRLKKEYNPYMSYSVVDQQHP